MHLLRALPFLLAVLLVLSSAPSASALQDQFTIVVPDVEIEPGGTAEVTIRLEPGAVPVAALTFTVEFPAVVAANEAEALVSGSCAAGGTRLTFAAFDLNGWSTTTDLCTVTLAAGTATGLANPIVEITTAADVGAARIVGTAAPGITSVTATAATPTPEPAPTAVPEPTAEPDPTAEPTPEPNEADADVPEQSADEPTPAPLPEAEASSDDAPDGDRGGRADAAPTALPGANDQDEAPDAGAEPDTEAPQSDGAQSDGAQSDETQSDETGRDEAESGAAESDAEQPDAAPGEPEPTPAPITEPDGAATPPAAIPPVDVDTDGGNTGPLVATVAVALFAVGGLLAAATRRANRNSD